MRLGRRIRMSYIDPKASGSFGGIQNVRRYGGEVKDLARNDAYTLHKSARVRFRRRKTYSKGPGNLFQIDLADLVNISSHNDALLTHVHRRLYETSMGRPDENEDRSRGEPSSL